MHQLKNVSEITCALKIKIIYMTRKIKI